MINGWHRIFSARGQADFFKGVCKLFSIGIVIWTVLRWQSKRLLEYVSLDPDAIPELILMLAMRLLTARLRRDAPAPCRGFVWVRMHWRKEIRMSKQEIKDELKETEGDPLKKARLRSLALDRRRKMHDRRGSPSNAGHRQSHPLRHSSSLCARRRRGSSWYFRREKISIALKIREIAEQHLIPIVEDKLLARSMYDSVEVDRPIPPEFYKAVAELIHILYVRRSPKAKAK